MTMMHVSEKPWSEFTKADYTPEQWHSACLIHLHDGSPTSKDQCKLPVRTPGGAISRPGVHAAAAALGGARGGVDAPSEAKSKAAKALIRYYNEFDEDPPASLVKHMEGGDPMTSTLNVDDFLEHFGVKGMKWGVHNGEVGANATRSERKVAKKESKLAYKAWKKEVGSEKVANEIFQEATKSFNRDVKIINNDPAFKGKDLTTNPRLRRQYDNAVSQQFNTRMANVSIARTTTNTGRAMIYQFDSTVGMMRATESQLVLHADDDAWPDFVADMDSLGHIISLRLATDEDLLEQAEAMADDILAHYGVKGMKWGRRKGESSGGDSGPTDVTTSHTPGQRVKASGGHRQPAHEDAIRTATARQKAKASTLDALSDKELKSLVNRMNMEKQYAQLVAETAPRSKGRKFVEGLISMVQVGGKQYGQQLLNEQMKNRMDEVLGVNKQREKAKDENAAREKARRETYK